MTSASKFFYKAVENCSCADFVHAGAANCWESTVWNLSKTITGCFKYVFPIAILPTLMRFRNLNVQICKQSAMIFVEYSIASWIMGGFGLSFICLFYHVFGKFYYSTVLFLPALCSSSICTLILSDKLIDMFGHGLLTVIFEIAIARGDTIVLKLIRNSKVMRTLAFMLTNMFLLHALRTTKRPNKLWFLQPMRHEENEHFNASKSINTTQAVTQCCHKYSCRTFIAQEIQKYLTLGLCVEVMRTAVTHYRQMQVQPSKFISNIHRYFSCDLTAFLIIYTAFYHSINCMFVQYACSDSVFHHSTSSFLAGSSFYLYPGTQLLCHALVTAIAQTWDNWKSRYKKSITTKGRKSPFFAIMCRLPIARIFYPFGFAYLLHLRAFEPWLAPAILKNLMNLTTNFKDSKILLQYYERLLGGASTADTLYLFGLSQSH